MAKKLQHFSHDCVLTSPEIVSDGICNICNKDEPVELACRSCNFDLCKGCSNLPQEVSHDFHPEHSFEFCLRQYDEKPGHIICSGCGNMSSDSFYKCKECEVYLDLCCALLPNIVTSWDLREMLHYSHCHMLRRSRPGPDAKGSCLLCEFPLSPSAICYGCVHCYAFFHERCLDLPTKIQHPVHQAHPLRRLDYIRVCGSAGLFSYGRKCVACENKIDGVPFGCLECDIDFHLRCLDSLLRGLLHKSHHHKLFYVARNAYHADLEEKSCEICMKNITVSVQSYYRCMECDMVFHFKCLGLPDSIFKKTFHIHPLVCKIYLAREDCFEYCGVCETMIHAGQHAYSCEECDFLGHIGCILCEEVPSPLYLKDLYSCGRGMKRPTDGEDCRTNSFENSVVAQIHTNRYIGERISEGTLSFGRRTLAQLYHVNDIRHVHVVRPVDMSELDKKGKCNMCKKDLLGSPYKCETCSFQTHHFCADLAQQSTHRLHKNHPLTLLPDSPVRWWIYCDICREYVYGFNLFCRICSFVIHISCALKGRHSLGVLGQKVIRTCKRRCMNVDHTMVGVIVSKSYLIACIVCDERVNGKALSCLECEEIYHQQCFVGQDQTKVFHPFHPDHCLIFSLKSGISKCIACKLNITKYCYTCFGCQVNFHIGCIKAGNISEETGSHCHIFYNFWMDDLRETRVCSVCGKKCGASFYGCIECKFKSHVECLGFPNIVKNQQHHHIVAAVDSSRDLNCDLCGSKCSYKNYKCNYCNKVFHKECIMSMDDREAATEEEQLVDIYLMYIERDLSDLLLQENDS